MKLNFNHKSAGAWATLLFALLAAVVSILKAFGIEISADQTNQVTQIITGILGLLTAAGILTASTDKKEDDQK